MVPDISSSAMVPSESSRQHGPPLLHRVGMPHLPQLLRSYAILRLPRPRRAPLRSSLACDLPPRFVPWRGKGLPGYWTIPVKRAAIPNPVHCAAARPLQRPALLPSSFQTLSALETATLSRLPHAAHLLARLRFAVSVAEHVARLASGVPGSALAGRDSHPLDDQRDFQRATACFLPSRPALPGRTPEALTICRYYFLTGPKVRSPS